MKRTRLLFVTGLLGASVNAGYVCKLVKPQPHDAICGVSGYLNTPTDIQSDSGPYNTDLNQCKELLYTGENYRQSFGYDFDNSSCTLYYETLQTNGFVADLSSSQKFWSYSCFNCTQQCKNEGGPGDNVIQNGGFEYSSTSYYPFENYGEPNIVSPGVDSNNMFKCYTHDFDDCVLAQSLLTCPGQQYVFRFDYYIADPFRLRKPSHPSGSSSVISATAADLQSFLYATSETNGTWQKFTGSFYQDAEYPPGENEFFMDFSNPYFKLPKSHSTFYVDNLQAFPIKTPLVAKAGATSLLTNGDFETGQIAPWQVQSNVASKFLRIATPGRNSMYALEFDVPVDSHVTEARFSIRQSIKTVPGTSYILSYRYQLNRGYADYVAATVIVNDTRQENYWSIFPITGNSTVDGWYRFDRLFTAYEDKTNVIIIYDNQYTIMYVRLDDIFVKEAQY